MKPLPLADLIEDNAVLLAAREALELYSEDGHTKVGAILVAYLQEVLPAKRAARRLRALSRKLG